MNWTKRRTNGGVLRETTTSSVNARMNGAIHQRPREERRAREKSVENWEVAKTLTQTPSEWSAAVLERERRIKYTITLAVCSPVRYLSWGVRVLPDRNSNIGCSSARVAAPGIEWRPDYNRPNVPYCFRELWVVGYCVPITIRVIFAMTCLKDTQTWPSVGALFKRDKISTQRITIFFIAYRNE